MYELGISGSGIREGVAFDRLTNLIGITPRISHILNIPKLINSEGKALFEI